VTRGQELGSRGEDLATAYLERQGFRIIARNHRSRLGELDLVARDGDEVVFVEVKTRIGGSDVAPDESVTASKLERLGRLAERYMSEQGRADDPWRVDVVAVVVDQHGQVRRIDHLRGAFL
jgi:putative endonuclease